MNSPSGRSKDLPRRAGSVFLITQKSGEVEVCLFRG